MRSIGIRTTGQLALFVLTVALAVPAAAEPAPLDSARIGHLAGLRQIDGRPVDANRLAGRPVLVSFFASWCKPCNAQFEHMKLLHLAHAADGLEIVAVNLSENAAGFADDGKRLGLFLGRHTPVFPVVEATDGTAKLFGNVEELPTVFVFDRQGRAILHHVAEQNPGSSGPGFETLRRAVSADGDEYRFRRGNWRESGGSADVSLQIGAPAGAARRPRNGLPDGSA